MAIPTPVVQIGFDFTDADSGPYLTLDDPVKGELDNANWVLGGVLFYDVTDKVKSVTIQRGKNQALNQYEAGLANVVFNNNDRTFDPEFEASPYYGQIIPKRELRIFLGDEVQFYGTITDWNLNYEPGGESTASAACADALIFFANQTIFERTNSVEKSGTRLDTILTLPEIAWPEELRDIETGQVTLGADTVADSTNALDYMRLITKSEEGSFFISKSGQVSFRDRFSSPDLDTVVLSDTGSGIGYTNLVVEYGSELLYNEVVVSSVITETAVQVQSEDSISNYGILNLTRSGLLVNDETELENLALFLVNKYQSPEYRFKSLTVAVEKQSLENQNKLLALEIGDVAKVEFTPNGIAPAIEKYAEIISITHAVDSTTHSLQFGFSTLSSANLILDNAEFGKLDEQYILGPEYNAWTLNDTIYGRLSAGMAVS